jgi:hypothetical protein
MKALRLIMAMTALTGMQSVSAGNTGQNVLIGAGTGVASLGVFYSTQSNLGQTEGKALAASALAGIVLSAAIQAAIKGETSDYFATLASAALTFGLTKYIYEQNQGSTGSQGSQQ